jgi:Flp pilus assembly protein TadG
MRVMPSRRFFNDESGATAVVVALLILTLVGFAAIAVDGGTLFARHRHMVTATDAAVLTAALQCGKTGTSTATAQSQANAVALQNVPATNGGGAQLDSFQILQGTCGATTSGTVKVTYHSNQTMGLSRVLGMGSTRAVHATATAVWGVAGSAAGVMPFMLSAGRLSSCNIPPGPAIGTKCAFWWNNSTSQIANAQWGMLNLNQWNVSTGTNCTSAGSSSTLGWINGGAGPLTINWPQPTYVCIDTGVSQTVFGTSGTTHCNGTSSDPLICQVGKQFDFPVNDPCNVSQSIDATAPRQGQIDKSGNLVRPSANLPPHCDTTITPGTPDKYDIIGFASLKIVGVYRGNSAGAADPVNGCGAVPGFSSDPNGECLVASWQGFQTGGGTGSGGGGNFGLIGVNLIG